MPMKSQSKVGTSQIDSHFEGFHRY